MVEGRLGLAPNPGGSDNIVLRIVRSKRLLSRLDDVKEGSMSPIANRPMSSSLLIAA
jgi:hypothetical protein